MFDADLNTLLSNIHSAHLLSQTAAVGRNRPQVVTIGCFAPQVF